MQLPQPASLRARDRAVVESSHAARNFARGVCSVVCTKQGPQARIRKLDVTPMKPCPSAGVLRHPRTGIGPTVFRERQDAAFGTVTVCHRFTARHYASMLSSC